MTFVLLLFDSREASELTSLSATCWGKLCWLIRKSRLFIPAGRPWRRGSNHNNFQQVSLNTTCLLLFSDLFVSSVNEHRLGSDPGFAPWRLPRGYGRSFHFPSSSVKKKKKSTQRIQWGFFQDARSKNKAGAVGKKTWWTQSETSFALIRPNWLQPPVSRRSERKIWTTDFLKKRRRALIKGCIKISISFCFYCLKNAKIARIKILSQV